MRYEELKEYLMDNQNKYLPPEFEGAKISFARVDKLNVSYEAMQVRMPGNNISVSVNLEKLYENMKYNSLDDAAKAIRSQLERSEFGEMKKVSERVNEYFDYEKAKPNLFLRAGNAIRNESFLQNLPCLKVGDLAFTAHLGFEWKETSAPEMSTVVTERLLEQWDVDKNRMFHDAIENMKEHMPPVFSTLGNIMQGMGVPEIEMHPPIFFLGNRQNMYGATAMLYPGILDKAYERIGDFYILPSSVHELLLCPESMGIDLDQLEIMVRSVNAAEVSPEEFLSDEVYHYDGKEKVMEKARDYEERIEKNREFTQRNPVVPEKGRPKERIQEEAVRSFRM